MSRGNAQALALGPGFLFVAPLGSDEVDDLTSPWPAAWRPLGYTAEGSAFAYSPSFEDVEVAEELDALDSIAQSRTITVSFSSAELTVENYELAMNGGEITVLGTGADAVYSFEPIELGNEKQCMIGFESEDHQERWTYRQCKQTGNIETTRRKGADKGMIPMEFRAYTTSTGLKPFRTLSIRGGRPVSV